MSTLPIHEYFHSWQGEGVHTGRSACFIRTFGCPVHCPWCDSAGTWHPDYVPDKVARIEPRALVDWVHKCAPEFVVITGGEPAIHDLSELTGLLRARHVPVHIETSGGFALRGHFDWVTVSPKRWKAPLPELLARADELKLIIEAPQDIDYWLEQIDGRADACRHVWLHPEWSHHKDRLVLDAISATVRRSGGRLRAGWQLHKLYNADALDPKSAKPAPLGGDLARGF